MPKMKTHRGAAKRVKVTGTGKLKRMRAYKSHILTKKTQKRKRRLRKSDLVSKGDAKRIARLLPYGS
jgi:large subunit ribosomal protein L35